MSTDIAKDLIWWTEKDKKLSDKVMSRARDIAARQRWRRANDEMYLRLYSEEEWRGSYGIERRRPMHKNIENKKSRLSINVVGNCVNAATSMLIRSRPYVSFQTEGADYSLMKLSKKRERLVQAHFVRERIHQLSQARVRNGVLFGTGGTKVIRDDGKITFENILPGEILVDEQEGIDGNPPCIYQAKTVDKLRLAELYPEHRAAIMKASSAGSSTVGESSGQCIVVYAWHFRSTSKKKHDGVEALCVDGATLYSRPYKWKRFPGTFYRWQETPFGFYGSGIPAELVGIQYEINTLLRMVRDSCYFGGNVKILAEKGSNIAMSQLSNSTRIPIVEYVGKQPSWVVNDVASPQVFNHLNFLIQTSYQITGISQLDAQSQTPAAQMSGRARLVHQNNESLRFKGAVERYENGYIELAESVLWAATDMVDDDEDAEVIFRGHEHLETIKLSDVMIRDDEDGLDIQAWSSSQLAQSPGARMEQVDFLVQNGYLQKTRGLVMMDLGNDFRADMDMANAPYNLIDERLERITVTPAHEQPPLLTVASPYMDLDYAQQRAQLEIQRCELREGVPEENIDLLRDLLASIVDLKTKSQQQPAAPAGPTGGPGVPDGTIPLPGANAVPPGEPTGQPPMAPPSQIGVAA